MMIIFFLNGLSFGGMGLAAYLQTRQGGDFPLRKHLPWLAAFGVVAGITSWVEMFMTSGVNDSLYSVLSILILVLHPLTGLILLKFGWGIFKGLAPLPAWMSFIPGIMIVPLAYAITYAATTFITPSPITIPVDIWSRYLLYLPGSVIAGAGFLRQWHIYRQEKLNDVAKLMLGTGMAFLFEAFVVGLVVPAAPYGPASYYNYDRVAHNAFIGEQAIPARAYGLTAWLDYERVLDFTGLPIEFWRMLSAFALTYFVVRGLGVFETMRKRQVKELQKERDRAQDEAYEAQSTARATAENWTDALVAINRNITQFENVDTILLKIIETANLLLRSDFVGLGLLSEDGTKLLLKCHCHGNQSEVLSSTEIVDNPKIFDCVRFNRAYFSQPADAGEQLGQVCPVLNRSARALAVVPLELDNLPMGAIWIARCKKNLEDYTQTDLVWLEGLADQVVIAIQHGLMTSKLQSFSIVEERTRIAREMHDGLAQVLGYLNLQTQTLQTLQTQNKHEALQEELLHMRKAIQSAHADVRENILSLRTTLANEKGLVSALDEYLEEFSIQTGLETRFENKLSEDLKLASMAEVQLVCIMQEALANVRKHAKASMVQVKLDGEREGETDYIRMLVTDDGIGFARSASIRSFGLQTMEERAQSVEGVLETRSILGQGTTILCRLPCIQAAQLQDQNVLINENA